MTTTYATDAGLVIKKSIVRLPECTINQQDAATRVTFMVALLNPADPVWCLFYERGGDWTSFGDGDEHNPELVDEWMPDAIRDCVNAVKTKIGEEADEDMEWFADWANAAEETIKNKDEK